MARKEQMSKMKMPPAKMEDEMLELDELEMDAELDMEDEAGMDEEMMDLTEASDEDLMAELEARGFMVEQPESEDDEMEDEELV